MLRGLRVALVVAVLLFVPYLRDSFEPPKAEALRVAGIALLIAAFGARRDRDPLDLAVIAWLATEALATIASRSPLLSLIGEPMQREGLLTSTALAGLYAGTRAAHADASRATGTMGWLIAASALAALYVLAQAAGFDPFSWQAGAVYAPGGALERPSGTFGHPNLMGVAGAAATVAALALALASRTRRPLYALAALVIGAATVATLSRASWLALAIGAPVAVLLALRTRRAPSRGLLLGVAAVLIGGIAMTLVTGWGPRLAARFAELLSPASGAGASRIEIWRSALHAWQARPWLGQGPDTFALVFHGFQTPAYWRLEWAGLPYHAHSVVLHALATRGAIGATATAVWAVIAGRAAWRAWRSDATARPLVAALVGSSLAIGVAGLFGAIGVVGAMWLVVAAATVGALRSADRARTPAPAGRIVVAGVVALAVATMGLANLHASGAARAADQALDAGRSSPVGGPRLAASALATTAVRAAPFDDAYHRLRAEATLGVASTIGDDVLQGAEAEARTALRLVPDRAENHEQLARVLAARALSGDPRAGAAAEAEIDRVAALAPMNALMLAECARLEDLLGRPARARAITDRLTSLYPHHAADWAR